jgi:hypothetical protein
MSRTASAITHALSLIRVTLRFGTCHADRVVKTGLFSGMKYKSFNAILVEKFK